MKVNYGFSLKTMLLVSNVLVSPSSWENSWFVYHSNFEWFHHENTKNSLELCYLNCESRQFYVLHEIFNFVQMECLQVVAINMKKSRKFKIPIRFTVMKLHIRWIKALIAKHGYLLWWANRCNVFHVCLPCAVYFCNS